MAGQCLYSLGRGMVTKIYVSPGLNFTFFGFEWLRCLHGNFMYYYFAGMALLALMVAFGYFYRISIFLLAVFWSAFYFSCKAHYNNHYYLMVLLCWMMVLMPAHKRFSVDANLNPGIATGQCYKWQLQLFVFQVACMYIFAAVAKINYDWLHAIPFKTWLPLKANSFFFGRILRNPIMPWVIVYGGLLFDLFVVPGLLYRKSRPLFFILLVGFHLFNGIIFKIGSFPFLAVSLCVFFFPAAYFDRFLGKANYKNLLPNFSERKNKLINAAVVGYAALQIFLPLRHFLIKGDVGWTEEGHRMAWQMMLRSKRGTVYFEVKDKNVVFSWENLSAGFKVE